MQYFKQPQNDKKYHWTHHVIAKMRQYKLSPSRVKRIIHAPDRIEESVAPGVIAVMKKFSRTAKEEIWAMYAVKQKRIVLISAWRYPGKSPERNPIPQKILHEAQTILRSM